MAKGKQRTKRSKLENALIGVCITVIVICVLILGVIALLNLNYINPDSAGNSASMSNGKNNVNNKDSINVLICGIDYSETDSERNGQKLTDLIMVANFDLKTNKVNILQIPRDTYIAKTVKSQASSYDKINSIYNSKDPDAAPDAIGDDAKMGIPGLARIIDDRFALPIDYYITITMDNFKDLIDDVGGVPINIPQRIVFSSKFGWVIPAGEQVLDGEKSEWFVRYRQGYSAGDIGRVQAQRLFMSAFVKKMLTLNTSELINLARKIPNYCTSNMNIGEMLSLAKVAIKLDMSNMVFHLLPGESVSRGVSLYTAHKQQTADLLNQYFRPYSNPVPAEALNIVELANTSDYFDDNGGSMDDVYTNSDYNPGVVDPIKTINTDTTDTDTYQQAS